MTSPAFTQYHGTPITPRPVLEQLAGRAFCVSFAAPGDVARCHELGEVMIDNGAFTFWQRRLAGRMTAEPDWPAFYRWAESWLAASSSTWAVIPDVIDGDDASNDALIAAWPHGHRGAPVWHLHEPIARLLELAGSWPRICLGSSGAYRNPGSPAWHRRMEQAFNALCPDGGAPACAVHLLRGMDFSDGPYPLSSVDSTDIARNHCREHRNARRMADRWALKSPPAGWIPREQLCLMDTHN